MQRCSYYNLVMLDLWVKRLQVGTSLYLARSSLQAEFSNSSVTFSLGTAHGLCGEDPEIRQAEGKKSATARNPAAGTAAACNLIRGISKPRPKTGQLMVFVLSDRCSMAACNAPEVKMPRTSRPLMDTVGVFLTPCETPTCPSEKTRALTSALFESFLNRSTSKWRPPA